MPGSGHDCTLADLARSVAARLQLAGITPEESRLDAELLVRSVLGWDRAQWIAGARNQAPASLPGAVEALVRRREAREPMAYIRGRCEFWGLDFDVGPAVLIPRPESEIIVEEALARVPDTDAVLVDVGTGSGCLAISLARARPRWQCVATDISLDAIALARSNADRHGVGKRIAFRHVSLLDGMPDGGADVIVSNPPYVPLPSRDELQPEVRCFEPGTALFAGPDGLEIIRALVQDSVAALRPGGWLIFECGFGQARAVTGVLESTPDRDTGPAWQDIELTRDLQGIPRTAVARRRLQKN